MSETEEELFGSEEEDQLFSDADSETSTSRGRPPKGTRNLNPHKVRCHLCQQTYSSLDGYRKHTKKHVLEDLLKCCPGVAAFRHFCSNVCVNVLQEFQNVQLRSGITSEIISIAAQLQALPIEARSIFTDLPEEELWESLPSPTMIDIDHLHGTYIKSIHVFLTNLDKRSVILNLLKTDIGLASSVEALEWFISDFTRKLASKVEVFFIRCLKEPHEVLCQSEVYRDDPDDLNFQQSVHYIGGSAVKSLVRKPQRGLGTEMWSNIYDCLHNKFVVAEGMPSPGEDIEAWTNCVDRGGLKHVNEKVWSENALSSILKKEEAEDGSILHKNVIKAVSGDDILMFLWDDIIDGCLTEETNTVLLQKFCELFTNTWLRGVILRRKNAIPKVSRDKTAFRARISR